MPEATVETLTQRPLFGTVSGGEELKIPVIGITGKKASGKTLLGLTLDPRNTIEIAVEDSAVTYQLPLKAKYSLYEEVTSGKSNDVPKPIECWEWFQNLALSGDLKCRVLFVDPITDLQQGLVDWVRSNPEKFGKTADQYSKASGLLWGDVKSYLKMFLGKLSRQVECFIFTAHMGTVWKGGAPVVGKSKAKGVDTFYELASLYLHLLREPDPKTGKVPAAPTANIMPPLGKSRLARTLYDDATGKTAIVPILPPTCPDFDWDVLRKLVEKPMDYSKLASKYRAISDDLTEDERLQLQAEIATANREAEELKQQRIEAAKVAMEKNKEARQAAAVSNSETKTVLVEGVKYENLGAESKEEPEPAAPAQDVESLKNNIREQFKELGVSKDQALAAIAKRGGKSLNDLTEEKLKELHHTLWTKLTAKDLTEKK